MKFGRRGFAPPAVTETQISRTFRSPALRAGSLSKTLKKIANFILIFLLQKEQKDKKPRPLKTLF